MESLPTLHQEVASAVLEAGQLHVEHWGPAAAPPVLFIHGICASTRYWTARLGVLETEFHCVVPDLLGHGLSPKPGHLQYSLREQADALAPILHHTFRLRERPVPIIAHSMGNLMALELRRRFPEQVGPILGMGLPTFPSREEGIQVLSRLNPFARLTFNDPWYARHLMEVARFSKGRLGFNWFNRTYGLPRDCWEDGFSVTWTSLTRSLNELVLATDVQTLIQEAGSHELYWWHGTHDQSAPYEYTHRMALAFPEVPFETIRSGTHNVWIFQNQILVPEFARRLREYYQRDPR